MRFLFCWCLCCSRFGIVVIVCCTVVVYIVMLLLWFTLLLLLLSLFCSVVRCSCCWFDIDVVLWIVIVFDILFMLVVVEHLLLDDFCAGCFVIASCTIRCCCCAFLLLLLMILLHCCCWVHITVTLFIVMICCYITLLLLTIICSHLLRWSCWSVIGVVDLLLIVVTLCYIVWCDLYVPIVVIVGCCCCCCDVFCYGICSIVLRCCWGVSEYCCWWHSHLVTVVVVDCWVLYCCCCWFVTLLLMWLLRHCTVDTICYYFTLLLPRAITFFLFHLHSSTICWVLFVERSPLWCYLFDSLMLMLFCILVTLHCLTSDGWWGIVLTDLVVTLVLLLTLCGIIYSSCCSMVMMVADLFCSSMEYWIENVMVKMSISVVEALAGGIINSITRHQYRRSACSPSSPSALLSASFITVPCNWRRSVATGCPSAWSGFLHAVAWVPDDSAATPAGWTVRVFTALGCRQRACYSWR